MPLNARHSLRTCQSYALERFSLATQFDTQVLVFNNQVYLVYTKTGLRSWERTRHPSIMLLAIKPTMIFEPSKTSTRHVSAKQQWHQKPCVACVIRTGVKSKISKPPSKMPWSRKQSHHRNILARKKRKVISSRNYKMSSRKVKEKAGVWRTIDADTKEKGNCSWRHWSTTINVTTHLSSALVTTAQSNSGSVGPYLPVEDFGG